MLAEFTDKELVEEIMKRATAKGEALVLAKNYADSEQGFIGNCGNVGECMDLLAELITETLNSVNEQCGPKVACQAADRLCKALSCIS